MQVHWKGDENTAFVGEYDMGAGQGPGKPVQGEGVLVLYSVHALFPPYDMSILNCLISTSSSQFRLAWCAGCWKCVSGYTFHGRWADSEASSALLDR